MPADREAYVANGGDNVGVYVPVFLSVGHAAVVAYCVVFLLLVGVRVATYLAMTTSTPTRRRKTTQ
ncbi:hypothetical protein MCHLDSM_03496 [Mycolicibacterium chlorophenolicum]|uniref:Uncharacterized protein n=1 Tax=Mycolicibacterium chlorophenolicum TaxID=37916 RepID=A0A0J6W0S0_9MYCO|nr:hypothetical protein MCHLDSM_03496 [Mycolicibacterium chlorophenolicum]